MNRRLSSSASPYLRSHAGNPVAWYPWGEEAFAEARRRDVPVFVSIGYSTCHWCHVMARESFDDAATAADLDAGFVSIKVDREEHPDVDAAYMAAAGAFSPSLGWPLSVFATPEGRPFFAGTYFPPEPRAGMPAFRQVLAAVREAWAERREQVDGTGAAILDALAEVRASSWEAQPGLPDSARIVEAARALAGREDRVNGGFGDDPSAPKFPVATALGFLQCRLVREEAPDAAAVASRALAAMTGSELWDRVEGGFFRYATRADWTVPHYEKMLIDNAQLLDAARIAGDAPTVRAVAAFLRDVLQQPGGGFGAAQDSESIIDGVRSEGGYYLRDDRRGLEPPAVDGKIVSGWNGLAIGALARAGAVSHEPAWIESARWAADAVLESNIAPDGGLLRSSLDEIPSRAAATLADHGQLAAGLVALAAATGDVAYARRARDLVDACMGPDGTVVVPGGGDPVLTAQGFLPPPNASDGDEPSGATALADAAVSLWLLGAGDDYRALAERLVAGAVAAALAQPLAHGGLLRVAAMLATAPHQVVVVTTERDDPLVRAAALLDADVVVTVDGTRARAWEDAGFALLAEKTARGGVATAYDCHDFACRLPVTEVAQLRSPD